MSNPLRLTPPPAGCVVKMSGLTFCRLAISSDLPAPAPNRYSFAHCPLPDCSISVQSVVAVAVALTVALAVARTSSTTSSTAQSSSNCNYRRQNRRWWQHLDKTISTRKKRLSAESWVGQQFHIKLPSTSIKWAQGGKSAPSTLDRAECVFHFLVRHKVRINGRFSIFSCLQGLICCRARRSGSGCLGFVIFAMKTNYWLDSIIISGQ